jgi:hypothetical protein
LFNRRLPPFRDLHGMHLELRSNWLSVFSPRIAAVATRALNCGLYCFLVVVIELSPSMTPPNFGLLPGLKSWDHYSQRPSLHDLLRPSLACVRPLRGYYAAVRLPIAVHVGLIAHRLLPPIRRLAATDGNRVPRFSRVKFLCVRGVYDSAGPQRARDVHARCRVAFRLA